MSMTSPSMGFSMIYNMAGKCRPMTLFSNSVRQQSVTLMQQCYYVPGKHIFFGWSVLCWGKALAWARVLRCERQKTKFWPPSNLHSSGPSSPSFIYTLIEFFIPGLQEKHFIGSYFWLSRNIYYSKKYIVAIIKAPLFPLMLPKMHFPISYLTLFWTFFFLQA